MAGKNNKKKSGHSSGGKNTAVNTAVLYGIDAGSERGDTVRAVLKEQGLLVKTIGVDRLADPVGSLAGMVGFRPAKKPFDGEIPQGEFMLLCNMSSSQIDALLAAMRAADCVVACKAQVTKHNRLWPVGVLIGEITREHAAMTSE